MNKYKETYGVDISQDVFDVYGSLKGHLQFKNTEVGFKSFLKSLPEGVSYNGSYRLLSLSSCTVPL